MITLPGLTTLSQIDFLQILSQVEDTECMLFQRVNPETEIVSTEQVNLRRDGDQIADDKGNTWLHLAALSGNEQMVDGFLKQGKTLDLEAKNNEDDTVLMSALKGGNSNIVKALVDKKADVFAVNSNTGSQPIHIAVEVGNISNVALLLERGVNVNETKKNSGKWSVLHLAANNGDALMTQFLLDNGAKIIPALWHSTFTFYNVIDEFSGATPVFFAAQQGSVDVIRILIKAGDNPHGLLSNGTNVLHWANIGGNLEACQLFLSEYHVNPNQLTLDGKAPFHTSKNPEILECFLENGAQPDLPNKDKKTLLWDSCNLSSASDLDFIILLLKHGANANQKFNKKGIFSHFFECLKTTKILGITRDEIKAICRLFKEKGAKRDFELCDNYNACPDSYKDDELFDIIQNLK